MAKPIKEPKEKEELKNPMPWDDEKYQANVQILKDHCKKLIIHKELPIGFPKSFKNIDYIFFVSIPTLCEIRTVNGLFLPKIFPRLLIASLVCPPKYDEFKDYAKKTELEYLQFWKGQVQAERDDYYKLKNHAEDHHVMTYETLYMSDILEKIQDLYEFKER